MFSSNRGDRPEFPSVCVMVTNANSNANRDRTLPSATDLRNIGAYIITVAVGLNVDMEEVRGIASRPHDNFVFRAPSQNDLPALVTDVVAAMCDG